MRCRLRASGLHLGVSLAIAATLVLLVTQVWYPDHLFTLAQGRHIFFTVVACDVVLGPTMTLLVFNVRKPHRELVVDVAIIAAVQLAALGYGVSTLLAARPAYIVYNVGQFNVPLADEMSVGLHDRAGRSTVRVPWIGPKLVGALLPKDPQQRTRLLFAAAFRGGDVYQMTRYFVPYDQVRSEVLAHAKGPAQIAHALGMSPAAVTDAVSATARKRASVKYLPLVVRNSVALAMVDGRNGDFLGVVPLPANSRRGAPGSRH